MTVHYIGADVDSRMTNLAVERNGRVIREFCVPTTIAALREVLESIGRPRWLTFEEGPMADWLARNLRAAVEELLICDPRRNALINQDGDKDDVIDARKPAALYRGGYLREVHHSDDPRRVELKQWVGLYHDRVREAVRQVNKIRGRCWQHGLRPRRGALRNAKARQDWLRELEGQPAKAQMELLFMGFDTAARQAALARKMILTLSRGAEVVKQWQELPGVGPIRAITLYAYLDTPWRFGGNSRKLWKYCGVGLERSSSGKDRRGRMRIGQLQLAWQVNRRLKDAVMGAAVSAIGQGKNVFAQQYERLVSNGLSRDNARHTVARKLLTVLWGMWKSGARFDPRQVCGDEPKTTRRQQARQWLGTRAATARNSSRRSPLGANEPPGHGRVPTQ